jgi:hypothetical protein
MYSACSNSLCQAVQMLKAYCLHLVYKCGDWNNISVVGFVIIENKLITLLFFIFI